MLNILKVKMIKLYISENISSHDLLKKVLKENNLHDEVRYNANGKPYLKNNSVYFNLSDKDNYTALVLSNQKVGIDMERITFRKNIISKICNEEEKKLIKNAQDFTILWVKKESYVKYLGTGLSYGLKNVNTLELKNYLIKKFRNYYIAIYGDELN